jgi:hypothetical protein
VAVVCWCGCVECEYLQPLCSLCQWEPTGYRTEVGFSADCVFLKCFSALFVREQIPSQKLVVMKHFERAFALFSRGDLGEV